MENYYLEKTGTDRDRTEEIAALLREYGVCRLGPGDFFVKNLVMPESSTLSGCGNATRLILDLGIEEGFAVQMQSWCTVSDLMLMGSLEDIALSDTVGGRHGILWLGSYDADKAFPKYGTVHGVSIQSFCGGGITERNTGYPIQSGLNVSDCYIRNCGAGINIDYWSEFNRYSNVQCFRNYYGAVNNGGNNCFVNCCFSGNVLGFLMDNSRRQSPNNSHGSVTGCIFDHSDSNHGTGIRLLGIEHGEIFTGCQVFFSKIEVIDSDGAVFSGFNFGKDETISVSGGGVVLFTDCVFRTMPQISVRNNEKVHFTNCWARDEGLPVGR